MATAPNVLAMLRESRLHVGPGVLLHEHAHILGHPGARIVIGEGTFLNRDVSVVAIDRVEIGAHCLFAHGCFIADNDHRIDDHTRPVGDQGLISRGPVRIGDNVWCGANVVVTSGVTIGERSVIGANSVVTHDIPPYSIAVGAPARVVGVNRPATRDAAPAPIQPPLRVRSTADDPTIHLEL